MPAGANIYKYISVERAGANATFLADYGGYHNYSLIGIEELRLKV